MGKRKSTEPQRLGDENRFQRSWNMVSAAAGQLAASTSGAVTADVQVASVVDDLIIQIENDEVIQQLEKVTTTRGKKRKKLKSPPPLDDSLQQLIDDCDFYLTVVVAGQQLTSNLIVTVLGRLDVHTTSNYARTLSKCLRFTSECWIYVSTKPGRSFLYYEWPHVPGQCPNCSCNTLQRRGTLHVVYSLLEGDVDYDLFSALRSKWFALNLVRFEAESGRVEMDVQLLKSGLLQLPNASYSSCRVRKDVCKVMEHFYCIPVTDFSGVEALRKSQDIEALYSAVKAYHDSETLDSSIPNIQHRALLPSLRPYQIAAVRWMLSKENYVRDSSTTPSSNDVLHQLYVQVQTPEGQSLFYNRYAGYLVSEKPLERLPLPGGILADEMGLGKTVEVLACILMHPRPMESSSQKWNDLVADMVAASSVQREIEEVENESQDYFATCVPRKTNFLECICGVNDDGDQFQLRVQCQMCWSWQHAECVRCDDDDDDDLDDYFCPHCWSLLPPYPSRATLIVSPATIGPQWLDEIERHVRRHSLRIFHYQGVRHHGFIQPRVLADYDVVLVSYATLRNEVDFVDLPHCNSDQGRRFRHPKRFMAIPTSLVAIDWWRVCLDEAQMVECATTKTAEMALRFSAVNRWCVTGTPIQKNVDDVYGLLLFLDVDPYSSRVWWERCLLHPYLMDDSGPMHRALGRVLWRTSKNDVLDQVSIPPQRDDVYWLSFTPVEEHFYRNQHMVCSRDMLRQLRDFSDYDTKLSSIDRKSLAKLLAPLLRLRQACVHPQVVRGHFMALKKNALTTMDELLDSLIKKVKVECEEAHRLLILSLNGLASIHIIKEEWAEAAEMYREVLRSARELRPRIKADKLPRLHALNNLAEILEAGHPGVPPTVGDDDVPRQAKKLHDKYLQKCSDKVRASQETCAQLTQTVGELSDSFSCRDPWWASILGWATKVNRQDVVVERAKTEVRNVSSLVNHTIINRFRTCDGLKLVISKQLEDLHKRHSAVSKAVLALEAQPSADVTTAAVGCHLRPVSKRPKKCIYCVIHNLFKEYEAILFTYDENNVVEEASTTEEALLGPQWRGTWADGVTERLLKGVLAFARGQQNKMNQLWIEDGQLHIRIFEALKKEFRGLRGVWMQMRDQVSALDELNMANTRLRVRLPDEPRPDPPQPDVLEPSQVDHHRLKLASDRVVATRSLQRKLGQMLYLQNLSQSDYGRRGGSNPELCPICQQVLGHQWSVLLCGHCFCVDCIRVLIVKHSVGGRRLSVGCAVCRQATAHGEISYVSTREEPVEDDGQKIDVAGSHSTKVEAVVRLLMQIRKREPPAKILVFTTWMDVLKLLQNALHQNDISHCCLASSNKFEENLRKFKCNKDTSTLLLLVQSGANGLNLIEATHVILVEPILNPASELQAIGRVHRIGQTKPTVVHRLLVRRTIEERMHEVSTAHTTTAKVCSHSTEENVLTIRNLYELFTSEAELGS